MYDNKLKKKNIRPDLVIAASCLVMLIALCMKHFVSFKTSRIASGTAVSARECFGSYYGFLYVILAVFFALSFLVKKKPRLNFFTGFLAAVCIPLFLLLVSQRYTSLPFDTGGNARMSFGVGFLLVFLALYCIMIKCSQDLRPLLVGVIDLTAWGGTAVFLVMGYLNNYSVMREYMAVKNQFFLAVSQHIRLSLIVLLVSVVLGIPLGYLCTRHKRLDSITLVGLSITETIPTLALFAIMRIPLAYLADTFPLLKQMGIGSFGLAPAFIALLFYSLYLMVHNSRAAFSTLDAGLIESAYALGMTQRDVFFKVQLPMALPLLLSGIRITLVSTIVSASLASYIGGGGLGTFIVNGINALSIDMQLLGVIPIFILTVCADYLVRGLCRLMLLGRGYKKV